MFVFHSEEGAVFADCRQMCVGPASITYITTITSSSIPQCLIDDGSQRTSESAAAGRKRSDSPVYSRTSSEKIGMISQGPSLAPS
jgi:hypothetical protein